MKQKGFSLVELNVCCAILTILMAVSYPVFNTMQESAIFKSEMRGLYANLQRAKVEAIKRNQYVVFNVAEKGYTIFVDDGAGSGIRGDWVRQGAEKVLVDYRYPESIKMVKTTFPNNCGRFRPIVGIKPGRIQLQGPSGSRREVVINRIGRIRLAKL